MLQTRQRGLYSGTRIVLGYEDHAFIDIRLHSVFLGARIAHCIKMQVMPLIICHLTLVFKVYLGVLPHDLQRISHKADTTKLVAVQLRCARQLHWSVKTWQKRFWIPKHTVASAC